MKILSPAFSFLVTLGLLAWLSRSKVAAAVLDRPNQRSLHSTPVPRIGGIGMAIGVATGWLLASPAMPLSILAGGCILFGLSLLDDVFGISVATRLGAHFLVAAGFVITAMPSATTPWLSVVLTLAVAWMTNLYNFMDGSDGLAGGMAVFGFGAYGLAALAGGDFSFAAINLSVAAAACAFLFFNFPPARVFMGDVGAIPLGYLAAVLDVTGWLRGNWPWWFGIAVFSPFIVDASYTLLKRLLRGAKVWQPHREHFYQRLVQSGWGHRKTAVAEYVLMALCSGAAIFGARQGQNLQLAVLGALALFYAGLVVALERYFPRHA